MPFAAEKLKNAPLRPITAVEWAPRVVLSPSALGLLVVVVHQRLQIATLAVRLSEASRVDALTGLLNRRAFEEMLDFELDARGAPAARSP